MMLAQMRLSLKNSTGFKWAIIGSNRHHPAKSYIRCNSSGQTIDDEEVKKFSEISKTWWDESGEFKALHTLNQLRIPLVRDGLIKERSHINASAPLEGFQILDVGCGGGLLSEPLARLGAFVTGLDASPENVDMAQWHAQKDPIVLKNTRYVAQPVEDLVKEEAGHYDAVVASEILEHVADPNTFVKACCDLVKPEGSLFVTTLNKTTTSWALAVIAAEQVLRLVPRGAHDWNKFVNPQQLQAMLQANGMQTRLLHGMLLNPLTLQWNWTTNTNMNYALHAVKPPVT